MNSIILVGNGPDILNYEAGKDIDNFEVVVRFNNFETKGFEQNVGSKTDIWATRICSTIKDRQINCPIIGVVNYCKYTYSILKLLPSWLKKYPETEVITPEKVKEYSEIFNYNPTQNWLSVGLIVLMYLIETTNDVVTLHGFSGDTTKHYFPLDPKDHHYHKFDLEHYYIENLKLSGKVKYLYE